MQQDFWKDKRVLITGADGFIGSHLTEKLIEYRADVSIYVRGTSDTGTTEVRLKNLSHVKDKISEILTGNIGNRDCINHIVKNNPQIIFHLAADAYVPKSFTHPIEVMETNLIGTLNVLHATMKIKDIEQIVCTSSSEVYGSAKYVPIDENHPLNPSSPYAASKAAADRYCFAYWNTYGLPIAIIRPFNTYGSRHTYDVIPKFISLAISGKALTVNGTGEQTRDFTYVDDTVQAFILMGSSKKAVGNVVNFGTGIETKIKDLAEKIIKLSKSKSRIIFEKDRLAQVNRLCCDFSKAKKMFRWEPKTSLDEGLKKNIAWFKKVK